MLTKLVSAVRAQTRFLSTPGVLCPVDFSVKAGKSMEIQREFHRMRRGDIRH
jgi:hypothetical protein